MNLPTPSRIGLLLIDDHSLFRRGLKALLKQDGRFEVSADVGDVGEALRQLARGAPMRSGSTTTCRACAGSTRYLP